jgi:hypothetical protein
LRLLGTGQPNAAIAHELVVALKTVDRHVTNIWRVFTSRRDRFRVRTPPPLARLHRTTHVPGRCKWGIRPTLKPRAAAYRGPHLRMNQEGSL